MAAYNIPLEVKNPQIENPLDVYGRVLQNRNLMQQSQLHQAQLQAVGLENQQRQNNLNAEKDLGELLAKNTSVGPDGQAVTDHAAIIQGLSQRGHGAAALKYDADRRADQTAALANAKNKLEIAKQQADQFAGILGSVVQAPDAQKPVVYAAARAQGIQRGLIRPEDAPPDYDPNFVQQHYQSVLTAQQQIDKNQKDLNFALRLNEFNHKVATEAPKTAKEWEDVAAQVMSAAGDQNHWTAGLNTLKQRGAPDDLLKRYPATYTPDAQATAGEAGITPEHREQRASREQQAEENRQARLDIAEQSQNLRRDIAAQNNATRRDLGQQSLDLRRDLADARNNPTTRPMTPGQMQTEKRAIANLEDGTPTRPGLNNQRERIGRLLKRGVDEKGQQLDDNGRDRLETQLKGITENLQNVQYRKADLYKIGKPNPQDVDAAQDGEEIAGEDGSTWVKKGGVAFFGRPAGAAAPPPRTATTPAAAAPKPQASQPAPQAGPKVGQRFKNPAGKIIRWDGTNYIDESTGKPYRQ